MDTAAVVQTVHFSAIFNSGYVRLNYTVWLDLFKSEQSACTANGHNIVNSSDCVFLFYAVSLYSIRFGNFAYV